jgi:hypothetical protein
LTTYKRIALATSLAVLTGCNGTLALVNSDEPLPGYFSLSSAGYLFHGSAIQWNQHYAVSVSHIPMLPNVVYHCSTGCDLVFIRRDADGPLPNWRPTIIGERVETVGQSPMLLTVRGTGTSKAPKVRLDRSGDTTAYALNDAPVVQGMSGGPVYGHDGAVVGMTIGIFRPQTPLPGSIKDSKSLSVYVPYEIIQREWRLFTERQAAADSQQPNVRS